MVAAGLVEIQLSKSFSRSLTMGRPKIGARGLGYRFGFLGAGMWSLKIGGKYH
jgi:hypothetical protein